MSIEDRAWLLDHWDVVQREIAFYREHREFTSMPFTVIDIVMEEESDVVT